MPNDTTEAKRAPSVLLFIPHPDDEVYALLILVLLCRYGIHFHIICATYAGTDREDECRNSIEVISAVATVSPTFEFLDYQDTKLFENIPELAAILRSHIDRHRPSVLLTVSGSDARFLRHHLTPGTHTNLLHEIPWN